MKQVLQNMRTGETFVADVPIPKPKPGTVLVRTGASLVSAGTERMVVEFAEKSLLGKARSRPDLLRQVVDKARREGFLTTVEAAYNRLDQPMVLGYSSAGTVTALGEQVGDIRVGERVACAGGGYAVHAEYAIVPRNLVAVLPEGVGFDQAAFSTLGAIALHGFRLAEAQLGERIAVIGLGLLGLLAMGIARAAGCAVLGIDINPARVSLAQAMGGQGVLREDTEAAARSFSRGRGCDAVLICADTSSADPVELAGTIARERGRVIAIGAVGLHLPRKIYYEKELAFINSRSYGPGRYDPAYEEAGHDYPIGYVRWTEGRNLEAFADLLAEGRIDVNLLITHRFPIEQAEQAYELITGKRQEPYLGVLLTYPEVVDQTVSAEDGRQIRTRDTITISSGERSPKPASPTDTVHLGVLGAGSFTTGVMLPAICKLHGIERVGIASGSGVSAQNAASRFGFRYASSDEQQILEDPEINTIAVMTRHHLHARQTLAALRAGKHTFCEKPLAVLPEELEEVRQTLGDENHPNKPLLTVGYNRRFAPLAVQLSGFLEGRGEPLMIHYRVNAGFLPVNHWLNDPQQGGGRIIGEGCHFIDFLTFLVGQPPQVVTAHGLPDQGSYHEDNVVMTLQFPDGSLGTVTYLANGDKSFPKERVEVFCGGRVAVLDDFRSLELVQGGQRKTARSHLRQDKGHRAIWQAFIQAIILGGPPPIPYVQLLGVTQAAFAAVKSLRIGETVEVQSARGGL